MRVNVYSVDVNGNEVTITNTSGASTVYSGIDKVPDPIQEKITLLKLLKVGGSHEHIGVHIATDCYVIYD